MYIQLIVVILAFVTWFITERLNVKKPRLILSVVCCVMLILQSGLRNVAVGPDTYRYFNNFNIISDRSWDSVFHDFLDYFKFGENKDPGYALFIKLFQVLFPDNFQVYLVFVAICFFVPFIRFLYLNTSAGKDILLGIILYESLFYEFFSITGIRQTLATAICLICFEFIKKKKIIPFLILMLLASTLHKSSLIFIPFYFIANIKNCKSFFVLSLIAFPVLVSFGSLYTMKLATLSGSDRYMAYASETTTGAYNFLFFFFSVLILGMTRYKQIMQQFPESNRIINALSVAILLCPLTFNSAALMRVVQYYSIFLAIFISYIFHNYGGKYELLYRICECVIIIALLYRIIHTGYDYAFFWEYMELDSSQTLV